MVSHDHDIYDYIRYISIPDIICTLSGELPMQSSKGVSDFIPIVLLSCSRDVSAECQGKVYPFEYIKGAGDDEENWAFGLSPRSDFFHYNFSFSI